METSAAKSLRNRYKDAYSVASAAVGIGSIIKGVGVVLGLLIFFGPVVLGESTNSLLMASGVLLAIIIGIIMYMLGILTSAQGQILKASLDSAVNSSPFLSSDAKAEIMSLPRSLTVTTDQSSGNLHVASTKEHDSGTPVFQPMNETDGWKCRCGQTNTDDVTKCPNCGRVKGAII